MDKVGLTVTAKARNKLIRESLIWIESNKKKYKIKENNASGSASEWLWMSNG